MPSPASMISIWIIGRSTRVISSGQWGNPGGRKDNRRPGENVFFQLLTQVKHNLRPEIIRVVRIAAVPGQKLLEIMSVAGLSAFKRLSNELMSDGKIIVQQLLAYPQPIENNTLICLHTHLSMRRMKNIFIVFSRHPYLLKIEFDNNVCRGKF